MRILGIETSCDETAAAILDADTQTQKIIIRSNVLSTSLNLHAKTGGIIPEEAAREQIKCILPVIEKALQDAGLSSNNPAIDAIAVTYGPGLIGSLLVGVETAKTLSYVWQKPVIPVNHLLGHIYANWITESTDTSKNILFPALALIISGGHTDLVVMHDHGKLEWIGGTRDDAAGEAFDKIGRMLHFPYPAGPTIEQYAKQGNPKAFSFPRPMVGSPDFDFSFSGLKTAVFRQISLLQTLDKQTVADICASVQQAIIAVIVKKTIRALQTYNAQALILSGGVAANQPLSEQLTHALTRHALSVKLFAPNKSLCTDNAAMIAAAAFYQQTPVAWQKLQANPELYFD